MTQLLLIRHASNDWMKDRLAGWTPGVHLNADGREEAAALARRLDGYPIDAVYASPLERARETASYLAEPRGLEVNELPGVGELRCGSWTGRKLEELKKEPLWAAYHGFPSGTRLPDGETATEVQCRAVAALESLRVAHPGGVAAVVSHADVVKATVAHYVGIHLDLFLRLVVAPASLTVLRFTDHGPRLLLFNDTGTVPEAPERRAAPPAHGEASIQA